MEFIAFNVVCAMSSCTRSNTCARYAQYLNSLANADTFKVLNAKRMKLEGSTCPYHLVVEKQKWARGFRRIYASIPSGKAHYFHACTPYTQRRFYKARNGEIALDPEMQQRLLDIFEQHGADTNIGFDSYEEKEVLVTK